MIVLENNYLIYIDELKKKYPRLWIFRPIIWYFKKRFKNKLKNRLILLEKQFNDGLIKKKSYNIWKKMINEVL